MASRRIFRCAAAALLAGVIAGCGADAASDPPAAQVTEEDLMATAQIRTDRPPIADRFPALGEFSQVHWQGSVVGGGDPRVPGPSDVLIQAVVQLHQEDLPALRGKYDWRPAGADWDTTMSAGLRPYVPTGADWRHSHQYEQEVQTARFSGRVYLDLASGTVFLAVNSR
ncbi:hypothetical protein [Micromonospora sp. LOL_023]|uniref:hypothetical protein n=1 Tax=Micromonospora sp. LOL_023 TaxID=3345418 RepID=UPI003A8A5086